MYRVLHGVLRRFLGDPAFRIVHLSVQTNHLHLLVEAAERRALTRGMQSFAITAARALDRMQGVRGRVFAFRYHATQLTTPRQARNSLAYVLNNWRRHRQDVASARTLAAKVDPYSSALAFSGWRGVTRFAIPAGYEPLPVSSPSTELLAPSWRAFGLIDPYEVPGPFDER